MAAAIASRCRVVPAYRGVSPVLTNVAMIDVAAATRFMAGHARLLDRRRLDLFLGEGDAASVLAALDAYRNPDGGYGWGLEPDLRSAESQPINALHAFEVLHECRAAGSRTPAVELCAWLGTLTLDDGGLPFTLPVSDATACAPWFTGGSAEESSLHGTCAVVSEACRLARHDPAVAAHPWLERAVSYCVDAIARAERLHAYETMFALRLLDALADTKPELLARVAATIPPSGALPVDGGVEGEELHPLDYAPVPDAPIRAYVAPELIEADLDRLEAGQQADGGWTVDFASFSPLATIEWRGYATLRAMRVLADNGRLET